MQRLCDTSVPHPSVHPRVDALPRLLHQPSAHGQLTGTRKDGGTLLQMITKREQQLTADDTLMLVSLWDGDSPQTQLAAQVLAFKTIYFSKWCQPDIPEGQNFPVSSE